jgi:hypothetical protein
MLAVNFGVWCEFAFCSVRFALRFVNPPPPSAARLKEFFAEKFASVGVTEEQVGPSGFNI